MKVQRDDISALIVLILLIILLRKNDSWKQTISHAALAAVLFTILRLSRLAYVSTPIGAAVAALAVAFWLYPKLEDYLKGPLPCGIKGTELCPGSGISRWEVRKTGDTETLTALCVDGRVSTVVLPCKATMDIVPRGG